MKMILFRLLIIVPSVMAGLHLRTVDAQIDTVSSAIPAVVRIRGCNALDCERALGSGVIVHPAGVILTANHVTLTDPLNPASNRLNDFVIEIAENARDRPTARFRAELIAFDVDNDLALLRIYRDEVTNLPVANLNDLPAIKLADLSRLTLDDRFQILGYPLDGGASISRADESHGGYEDGGALIKIQNELSPGNSGGPALVEQDGELRIAGIVIERRGAISFLRSIDQLSDLNWVPTAERVWANNVALYHSDDDLLTLQLDLHGLDLIDRPVKVLAYVYTEDRRKLAASGAAQHRTAGGHMVLAADATQHQVIGAIEDWQLRVPTAELDIPTAGVLLRVLIWDPTTQRVLWRDTAWHGVAVGSIAVVPTPTPTMAIEPTATALPVPTNTATTAATETATVVPTATATNTATPMPTLTPTNTPQPPTSTPTPSEPAAGTVREFGGIKFVYVPAGEFLMGSNDADSSARDAEQPQHTVHLDGYWVMQTEVTNAMYAECVTAGACAEPGNERGQDVAYAEHPVTGVSWDQANVYATWVGGMLPTEAQWEKACRGTDGAVYPWGNDAPDAGTAKLWLCW